MKGKAFFAALAIFMTSSALHGQTPTMTGSAVMAMNGATLDHRGFLKSLAENPPATLVLFDTEEKGWEQPFERVRCEDPFAAINLDFMSLSIDDGVGGELREKEGWPSQQPRWAIFDTKGRMVADGAYLPTATQLTEACAGANIVGKVELLRRFLREHPNHEEARSSMLQEMLTIAETRTRYFLQIPEYRAIPGVRTITQIDGVWTDRGDGGPTASQLETLPELTSDADERIWAEYCAILQRHIEGALWQSGDGTALPFAALAHNRPIVSAWAGFSPMAKAAYSKVVPRVEAALARQPSSPVLWGLWLALHKAGAGRSMKDLLASLKPSPNVAPADWPPTSIRTPYLKMCREAGDWKAIQDLVEPIWVSLRDMPRINLDSDIPMGAITVFSQGFWLSNAEAYLEALLRRQRLSEAEQMMKTWASGNGWPGAFLSAAAIAGRLGYDGLTRSWREQGDKK